jgi:hypothetical protein
MFVTDRDGAYREILCVQEQRVVANDNTVSWNGRHLQIPESPLRRHFVKATVRVHEYPDGTASIFLGPHRLAQFTVEGTPIVAAPTNPIGGETQAAPLWQLQPAFLDLVRVEGCAFERLGRYNAAL